MKQLIIIIMFLSCYSSVAIMAKQKDAVFTAETGSPALFEKTGSGVQFLMTESEYQNFAKQLSQTKNNFSFIKQKPTNLSTDARYGINVVINGKNTSWILDGNENDGYIFYPDWDGDGDLTNNQPIKFQNIDGKNLLIYSATISEIFENRKQSYQYDLKIVLDKLSPPGETEKKPALRYYDSTMRQGVLEIDGRKLTFGLIGNNGIYDSKYNVLYFDINGDNEFEFKDIYSAERYKVSEKHINLGDKTYEFIVDRYGRNISLKLLPESLPARANLSTGYQAPDFSFTDISGKNHQLSNFRGKIVLLDFWGTWCAPCVAEAPKLASIYKELKDKGFEIISLAKEDSVVDIQKFINSREMFWVHSQLQDNVSDLYLISRYPTYFLIDKEGKTISNNMKAGEEMYGKIRELLNYSKQK